MIDLQHVTKTYAKNNKKAVDDLNLHVNGGELFGFIGPNGAGKTTTIKMMTGVLTPDEGNITMAGHRMDSERLEAQRMIGFVPDGNDLYDRLTGMEYLNFMADVYGTPVEKREPFIEECGRRFEIYDALGSRISDYSHGMRQKVHVMAALIHEPSVWILDEPLTGLDPQSAFELKKMMREHAEKGNSVFFSTHVLEVAEKLCDEICIIKQGELLYTGTLEGLKATYKSQASLENIFLELTDITE